MKANYELKQSNCDKVFKEFLRERGLNMNQLAIKVGASPTLIYKQAKGLLPVGLSHIFSYANAIPCSVEQLLTIFYREEMNKNVKVCNEHYDRVAK